MEGERKEEQNAVDLCQNDENCFAFIDEIPSLACFFFPLNSISTFLFRVVSVRILFISPPARSLAHSLSIFSLSLSLSLSLFLRHAICPNSLADMCLRFHNVGAQRSTEKYSREFIQMCFMPLNVRSDVGTCLLKRYSFFCQGKIKPLLHFKPLSAFRRRTLSEFFKQNPPQDENR